MPCDSLRPPGRASCTLQRSLLIAHTGTCAAVLPARSEREVKHTVYPFDARWDGAPVIDSLLLPAFRHTIVQANLKQAKFYPKADVNAIVLE